MTHQQMQCEATQLRNQLDTGAITAMHVLNHIAVLKQAGGQAAAFADILKDTVQVWHAGYAARMQEWKRWS